MLGGYHHTHRVKRIFVLKMRDKALPVPLESPSGSPWGHPPFSYLGTGRWQVSLQPSLCRAHTDQGLRCVLRPFVTWRWTEKSQRPCQGQRTLPRRKNSVSQPVHRDTLIKVRPYTHKAVHNSDGRCEILLFCFFVSTDYAVFHLLNCRYLVTWHIYLFRRDRAFLRCQFYSKIVFTARS
jgi:hypothetical protein